jgi:peptidyl-Lys metalloendopeptidase
VQPSTSQLGNEPADELIASIEAQGSLATGEVVEARFTLTNTSSEGLFVLKWFTPLEGLAGDIILVRRDGIEIDYRGKLVKRAAPTPEDYVWIDAGASVSAEIDLAEGYDFSQAGQYTVQFRSPQLSHTARTAEAQADSMDDLATIQIPSDPINVTIG